MNAKISSMFVVMNLVFSIPSYATSTSIFGRISNARAPQDTEAVKQARCNASQHCYITVAMARQLFNDYGVDKIMNTSGVEVPLAGFCTQMSGDALPTRMYESSGRSAQISIACNVGNDHVPRFGHIHIDRPACEEPVVITANAHFPDRSEMLCGTKYSVHYAPANPDIYSAVEFCQLFKDGGDLVPDSSNHFNLLVSSHGLSSELAYLPSNRPNTNGTICQSGTRVDSDGVTVRSDDTSFHRFQSAPIAQTHQCSFWVACPCERSFECAPGRY